MKIEEIRKLWAKDSNIEITNLAEESLNASRLHQKYYDIYVDEKLILAKYENDLKRLKLDKYEFYTQGPNEETPSDWQLPASGRILKSEVQQYIDADKDVINMVLKVCIQKEKVGYLESIVRSISFRSTQIKNAIEFLKFQSGG